MIPFGLERIAQDKERDWRKCGAFLKFLDAGLSYSLQIPSGRGHIILSRRYAPLVMPQHHGGLTYLTREQYDHAKECHLNEYGP